MKYTPKDSQNNVKLQLGFTVSEALLGIINQMKKNTIQQKDIKK